MEGKKKAKFYHFNLYEELPKSNCRVITADEMWVHYFDPLSKWESELWKRKNEARVKKIGQLKSVSKVMVITFSDSKGLNYQHRVR